MARPPHIVLFEHGRLVLGEQYDCVGGGKFLFDERHHRALSRFGERAAVKPFVHGHRSLCFRGFVGTLCVGRLLIEILPKADKRGWESERHNVWQQALALMLKEAGGRGREHLSMSTFRIHRGPLLEVYVARFLECVETLLHRGLARRYRQVEGNLTAFRGRLRVGPHIARNSAHHERFFVEYTTYDEQHLLNRVLHAALGVVRQLPVAPDLHGRSLRCLLAFPELAPKPISADELAGVRLDRTTERYREALALARLLLLHHYPGMERGDLGVLAILVDMSRLFEDFLGSMFRRVALPGLKVHLQRSVEFWQPDGGATRHLRPDIVLEREGYRQIVVDAKWKTLPASGPSIADVRQIYAYNQYLKASHSVLLYPHHAGEPTPTSGPFLDHDHRLSTATLRLVAGEDVDRADIVEQLRRIVEGASVREKASKR